MLLVADVLRRVVEDLHTGQALLVLVLPDLADTNPEDALRSVLPIGLDGFGIRPAAGVTVSLDAPTEVFGGPADVLVVGADESTVARSGAFVLRVGPVVAGPGSVERRDPLAARLALLHNRHGEAVSLGPVQLDQADAILRHWRGRVAEWAEQESAPMAHAFLDRARAALDANLNVLRALELLNQLMDDPAIPAGAKLETFVFLDRVLTLDLVRDLGQRIRNV